MLTVCVLMSSMLSSMTNSMLEILYLPSRSLARKAVHLSVLTFYPEVAGASTDPFLDAVDIVTDCLDTIKAEAVVRGGDVAGTLPRLLPMPNMPKLATPGDHKLRVGVAHPGVSAMDKGVGDGVRAQLVEVDHPHSMVFFCCQGELCAARTLSLNV